jgi:hypothetical protein
VAREFERYEAAGYTRCFNGMADVMDFLGGESQVLSRIGVIERIRNGKLITRIVIDSKRSGVSRATGKFKRVLPPGALDVVWDVLEPFQLHRDSHGLTDDELSEPTQFFVADFREAFFIVPNAPTERKLCVVLFSCKYHVFVKTTQGSRGAPLTWARQAALVSRLTQSVVESQHARINTYVDDPAQWSIVGARKHYCESIFS